MKEFGTVFDRLTVVTVTALTFFGMFSSLMSVANADEITLAMADTRVEAQTVSELVGLLDRAALNASLQDDIRAELDMRLKEQAASLSPAAR